MKGRVSCKVLNKIVFMLTDENMAAGRTKSFSRGASLMRSKSEGTLIDLDDSVSVLENLKGNSFIVSKRNLIEKMILKTDVLTNL